MLCQPLNRLCLHASKIQCAESDAPYTAASIAALWGSMVIFNWPLFT